jgi:hypothetical protein
MLNLLARHARLLLATSITLVVAIITAIAWPSPFEFTPPTFNLDHVAPVSTQVDRLLELGPARLTLTQVMGPESIYVTGPINLAHGTDSCAMDLTATDSWYTSDARTALAARATFSITRAPGHPTVISLDALHGDDPALATSAAVADPSAPHTTSKHTPPTSAVTKSGNTPTPRAYDLSRPDAPYPPVLVMGFGFLRNQLTPTSGDGPCNLADLARVASLSGTTLTWHARPLSLLAHYQALASWLNPVVSLHVGEHAKQRLFDQLSANASSYEGLVLDQTAHIRTQGGVTTLYVFYPVHPDVPAITLTLTPIAAMPTVADRPARSWQAYARAVLASPTKTGFNLDGIL